MFLKKRDNSNKTNIIKGLMIALIFSAFIYLAYFGFTNKTLNTILGLVSLYLILISNRKILFFTGFFIGILWFYWIVFSFRYYDLAYLAPLGILFFGFIYGCLFYIAFFFEFPLLRAVVLYCLSFVHPFGFNWFVPELIFIDTWLGTSKVAFAVILSSIYIVIRLNKELKMLAIIPLFFVFTSKEYINNPNLQISMPQLNVAQDKKWDKNNLSNILEKNLELINQAILEDKDLIIFPETAFPLVINEDSFISYNLLEKSKYIDIITGGIYINEKDIYNATYFFSKGKMQIAKKVVLVPFGEKIPFPKFLTDFINNTFYSGAKDYKKASSTTNFDVAGVSFRNAICYEATTNDIYKNLKKTNYMIAISNNAWFAPSIEPILQEKLLQYYARKYHITIFHSVNGSKNEIIRPYKKNIYNINTIWEKLKELKKIVL